MQIMGMDKDDWGDTWSVASCFRAAAPAGFLMLIVSCAGAACSEIVKSLTTARSDPERQLSSECGTYTTVQAEWWPLLRPCYVLTSVLNSVRSPQANPDQPFRWWQTACLHRNGLNDFHPKKTVGAWLNVVPLLDIG